MVAFRLAAAVLVATGTVVRADDVPDATDDGIEAVMTWAKERAKEAGDSFVGARHSSSEWTDAIVYHVVVDRFNNGDRSNDRVNELAYDKADREADPPKLANLSKWRHGGDLQGLAQRLDYIRYLGANTVLISPILAHSGYYDGHCLVDPTDVDAGFGSREDFRELVKLAHAGGLRVVLDIAASGMCLTDSNGDAVTYKKTPDYDICTEKMQEAYMKGPYQDNFEEQGDVEFPAKFFGPLRHKEFYSRCGSKADGGHSHSAGSYKYEFSDLGGTLDFNTMNTKFQEVFTELHKYWIAYADIDGFYLNGAVSVTEDFVAHFSTTLRAYAATLGKEDFYIAGEVDKGYAEQTRYLGKMNMVSQFEQPAMLEKRLEDLESTYSDNGYFPFPGFSGITNTEQADSIVRVVKKEVSQSLLANYFGYYFWGWKPYKLLMSQLKREPGDDCAATADARLWTALETQTRPRFLEEASTDSMVPSVSLLRRLRLAEQQKLGINVYFTLPGPPVIFYGQEQGFNGRCPRTDQAKDACDKLSPVERHNQDMFASGPWRLGSIRKEIEDLAEVGNETEEPSQKWYNDKFLGHEHELFLHIKKLSWIRTSCDVLRRGRLEFRSVPVATDYGPIIYSRILYDEGNTTDGMMGQEAVVVIGGWDILPAKLYQVPLDQRIHANIEKQSPSHRRVYRDLTYPTRVANVITRYGGPVLDLRHLHFKAGEIAIFVHDSLLEPQSKVQEEYAMRTCAAPVVKLVPLQFLDRCATPATDILFLISLLCVSAAGLVGAVLLLCWMPEQENKPTRCRGALSGVSYMLGLLSFMVAALCASQENWPLDWSVWALYASAAFFVIGAILMFCVCTAGRRTRRQSFSRKSSMQDIELQKNQALLQEQAQAPEIAPQTLQDAPPATAASST